MTINDFISTNNSLESNDENKSLTNYPIIHLCKIQNVYRYLLQKFRKSTILTISYKDSGIKRQQQSLCIDITQHIADTDRFSRDRKRIKICYRFVLNLFDRVIA